MSGQLRCVIIDDDYEFLEGLKRWFLAGCLDFEVLPFSNSVDAVEFVRHRRVDLILTAYLVPQIDGLQLISLVRSFNTHVPIVMISHVPIKAAALARGATAFLAKSATWARLESTLHQLRRRRQTDRSPLPA